MAGTKNFEIIPLSESVHGRGVLVVATSSPGTLIHTANVSATLADLPDIYAYNDHTADVDLRIEWGGTSGSDRIRTPIPFQKGLYLVIPGLILRNTLLVKAWAGTANVISLFGGRPMTGVS